MNGNNHMTSWKCVKYNPIYVYDLQGQAKSAA